MKIIKDYLEYQSDKYIRTLALHNMFIYKNNKEFKSYYLVFNFRSALNSAFDWDSTIEGYKFWENIYRRY
jgi:hypothetical protein